MSEKRFGKSMRVGLGEAIKRVLFLEAKKNGDAASISDVEELTLLMNALNTIPLDLGFDCDDDNVPDTIEIFTQTANTSCCRLIDLDVEEMPKPIKSKLPKKKVVKKSQQSTNRGSRGSRG